MYGSAPVPVGTGYRPGYLARPDKAGRFPVVVLIPDFGGLTAHGKHIARRLARRGLAVVAVNVYPESVEDPLTVYHSLDDAEVVRVLDETQEFLASDDIEWAYADTIGVLGLEVGGRFALIQSAHRGWVGAAAVVSTPLTGDEQRRFPVADMLEHLPRPVLGLYGASDDLVTSASVDEAQNRNASGSWLLYESARHAFFNDSSADYDEAAAEDAIARLVDFFRTHLPGSQEATLG